MNFWHSEWTKEEYVNGKREKYNTVINFLKTPPKTILDIGCGFAWESSLFQKNHNSKLWLMDGDFDTTASRSRSIKYGEASTMAFYSKIHDLKSAWDNRGLEYNFLDANNLNLSEDVKFDLVYSGLSCGFHYPANTYKDFILAHSHKDTKIIFDLRHRQLHLDVKIIEVLGEYKKHNTVQIQFL